MKLNAMIEIDDEELKELLSNQKSKKEESNKSDIEEINHSDYARFFDKNCVGWTTDPEYNSAFLKTTQDYCNNLLRTRGHLFLNEVYDMLGMTRTKTGAVVGWVYDEEHPIGDNFVDFRIYGLNDSRNDDFINGYKNVLILNFNVDGNILNYI